MPGPADFQSPLDSLKDYLDWNRWMIIGLVLWGLLVAIVIGAGSGITPVPCKGPNVTSSVVECTCDYPFPGTVWVVGLIVMFVSVAVELATDITEVKKRSFKMVKSHFGEYGGFELKSPENVKTLRDIAQHKCWVTAQLALTMQNKAYGIFNKVDSFPSLSSSPSSSSSSSFSSSFSSSSNPPLIDALWSNPPHVSNFASPVSSSSLLTPEESLLIQLIADMEVREALDYFVNEERKERKAGHIAIKMDGNNNSNNININNGDIKQINQNSEVDAEVVASQKSAAEARIKPFIILELEAWVRQMKATHGLTKLRSPYGISAIIGRGVSNLFLFYTIIAITTYNWFPIDVNGEDKGCWIPWESREMKDNSLLGIGMAAIVLLAIRIILFDIVDTSVANKTS